MSSQSPNLPYLLASAELENFPEGEIAEMIELYTRKGLPEQGAQTIVTAMASAPDFFVDVMMLEELQMSPPPAMSPSTAGVRVGGSAAVCGGALPLVTMVLHRASQSMDDESLSPFAHLLLLGLAAVALGYLGSLRAAITHQGKSRLALQTVGLALPCVLIARLAGSYLREMNFQVAPITH